jgi:hypothetical protein
MLPVTKFLQQGKFVNQRLILIVKWLVGIIAYIALSFAVCHGLVLIILRWGLGASASLYLKLEISSMRWAAFAVCLFWGALYASALAKPAAFGHISRIFKHFGWSYLLGFLGSTGFARIALLDYPDFKTMFALRVYVTCGVSLSILCFIFALVVWAHLAFGSGKITEKEGVGIADSVT